MSASCCGHTPSSADKLLSRRYRRVLWIALIINAAMFWLELAGGLQADSVSLLADAVDFFGDAGNYAISLAVLGMSLSLRSRAALFKGVTMGVYGVFVLGKAAWNVNSGNLPDPLTMGVIGSLALVANVSVAAMLWPDLAVAAVMGVLALSSARSVVLQARKELQRPVMQV